MTLVQLRHFVVLVAYGSYVQASKALFLTQPALTRSIQGLEDELGGALFNRLGGASRSRRWVQRCCNGPNAWSAMPMR